MLSEPDNVKHYWFEWFLTVYDDTFPFGCIFNKSLKYDQICHFQTCVNIATGSQ